MIKSILILGFIFLGPVFLSTAQAAQNAKVIVDSASVYDKPQADGIVIGTVTKDTTIAVSNTPTNGFYKSRIPGGAIGWISGNEIVTGAGATGGEAPPPAETVAETPQKKKKKSAPTVSDHSRILVSGGLQILNNTGFPAGISNLNSKMGFGGTFEMQFKLSDQFYWGGRVEYFTSSSTQTVSSTVNQELSFRTIPLMAGLMYVPMSKQDFRLGFGLYAGVSLLTSLTVTQSSTAETNAVTYSSSDLCFLGNVQGSYALSSSISLLGDVGYRIHSASYPASTTLDVDAFTANFGGLVARMGLEFRL